MSAYEAETIKNEIQKIKSDTANRIMDLKEKLEDIQIGAIKELNAARKATEVSIRSPEDQRIVDAKPSESQKLYVVYSTTEEHGMTIHVLTPSKEYADLVYRDMLEIERLDRASGNYGEENYHGVEYEHTFFDVIRTNVFSPYEGVFSTYM